MSSITEHTQQERLWNLDLPQGATEQEIVRARQRQYMEQQLATQEQLHAERTGRSPSPRSGQNTQSASPTPSHIRPPPQQSDGFRELLPRGSPQPYPLTPDRAQQNNNHTQSEENLSQDLRPPSQVPSPAGYPLPMTPDSVSMRSPVDPIASAMAPPPPPKLPHSPMHSSFPGSFVPPAPQQSHVEQFQEHLPPVEQYHQPQQSPRSQQPDYDQQAPSDEPPPYSGPGILNEGMDKDRPRPPNIITDASDRGRVPEPRQRQVSLGILQHPQPASMAASPQRSSADMGADILRRQLLEQEEHDRQERMQRAELQRAESVRERQERERARARARELERSVSGGGRVGSLRSAAGSTRTTASGWERRGSTTRVVYELPAEEDDEPVMRATSFPGQEWVPTWSED